MERRAVFGLAFSASHESIETTNLYLHANLAITTIINDKVLPILKKQVGFVDENVLVSDTEPDRVLAQSFWNTTEDAERYNREQYPAVHEMIRHLLEAEPSIRTFDVHISTSHKGRRRKSCLNNPPRTMGGPARNSELIWQT